MPAAYLQGPRTKPFAAPVECQGKARFVSAALAHAVTARRNGMGERQPYLCKTCGFYHVSGSTQRGINKRERMAANLVRPEIVG